MGTTSTSDAAGFRQVTRAAAHGARLPRWLMHRDLRA
jgi:hypothetical protein